MVAARLHRLPQFADPLDQAFLVVTPRHRDDDGYGTRHVHARLAATYGERASFSLLAAPDGQPRTWAELHLPLAAAALAGLATAPDHAVADAA